MSIATFCGYNEMSSGEEIGGQLYRIAEQKIQNGTNLFYLGGYGHFDAMAASTI